MIIDDINKRDFETDNSSLFSLEKELKGYSELVYKYGGLYAKAIKQEQEAELRLKIVVAELVKEYAENSKKDVSPYAMTEIRKSGIQTDERFKMAAQDLIDVTESSNILKGAYFSIVYKNERLKELFRMAMRDLIGDEMSVVKNKHREGGMQSRLDKAEMETGL